MQASILDPGSHGPGKGSVDGWELVGVESSPLGDLFFDDST